MSRRGRRRGADRFRNLDLRTQQLKVRLTISQVVEELGGKVAVLPAGAERKRVTCPFCEHDRAGVYDSKARFYCDRCNIEGADQIDLVKRYLGTQEVIVALEWLEEMDYRKS